MHDEVCAVCGLSMASIGSVFRRTEWLELPDGKKVALSSEPRHSWDASSRDDWTAVRTHVIGRGPFDAG